MFYSNDWQVNVKNETETTCLWLQVRIHGFWKNYQSKHCQVHDFKCQEPHGMYTNYLHFDFLTLYTSGKFPVILLFLISGKKWLSIILDELFTLYFECSEIGSVGKYS